HAEAREALGHFAVEVALELGLPLGVLALGLDGDTPAEVGEKRSIVEILLDGGDGGVSAHALDSIPCNKGREKVSTLSLAKPSGTRPARAVVTLRVAC